MRALSRRSIVAGLAAGAALASSRAVARHDLRVGAAELTVLSDGELSLPRSLVLPSVPPDALRDVLGAPVPDESFKAQTNVTVLTRGSERIVVDSGAGQNFQSSLGRLPVQLETAGIAPDSVTMVVFTHAHPDHLWGAIDEFEEPRFPKARYVISETEWSFWSDPDTARRMPEAMAGMAAGSARILKLLEPRIERRRTGEAVAPGLILIDTAGHTPGHASLLVETGGERLLIGGDVLTHERLSFARPDWEWGTDLDPACAAKARHATLAMLAEGGLLAAYHLPWPGIGRVEGTADGYRFTPV